MTTAVGSARMCVCVSVASSRHRRSYQSKSWHWEVPNARWTWLLGRCSFWGDAVKASCIISSASHMASEEHKRPSLCFWTCLSSSAHTTKAQTNHRKPPHLFTHRKHSRTAFNRPCTEQQSAYSSTLVSTRVRHRKQASTHGRASQVLPREPWASILFFGKLKISSLFLCLYILVQT